ncbi:MAG: nucleoside deaminase [Gammaproteobacteria bacterium]|jgi:tRNA(adenine34) deaminase|nr:nucleoside deaminase [Gammaproteobacteria bacterium]MBT5216770.1 nucleoside deaminase [Gammaproteobacteria bacterium]MBT5542271.1 nucleoside deaminase [Gammaproteobacteria bacterium]MBT6074067.1 nucleoside deaminase [Gammaproteobacteria bacterium]MDG2456169.1 tRNA adenosine(34) deaminase TadA [SAR86 cluster bacterium]
MRLEPTHEYFMKLALEQAEKAENIGEVPVGAVFVDNHKVLAASGNQPIGFNDPTAHAEILAIRQAAEIKGNYRIGGSLYVTLEPCIMCMGALIQARIEYLIFGAYDHRAGAAGTVYDFSNSSHQNHAFEVVGGILEKKCQSLIKGFFQARR